MTVMDSYLSDIWKRTLTLILEKGKQQEKLDNLIFNQFFSDSKLMDLDEKKALVVVPGYIQQTIMMQNKEIVEEAISEVQERKISCEIIMESQLQKIRPLAAKKKAPAITGLNTTNLIQDYTFDNFVVGGSNRESHSAALACAYNPGQFFNPLFIYGNSGLGKTHLLNAIGNYVSEHAPDKKVYYTTSEDFVNAVVNSIKNGQIQEFKEEMNDLDVLLVDDIQFLAGKEKSHETFFYIFNELVNNKKQICLTSDRHPTEIKGLEERLISRFSSGLSVGVDSPEFETSVAILKVKLEKQSVDPSIIDDDVLAYIASNFSQDVRKLEGALNRLLFYSINFSNSTRIDFKTAVSAFRGQAQTIDKNDLTASKIIRCVADYYGLTKLQLVSKTRTKNIATVRHMAMYLCRKHLDMPYVKIGDEFGKRDHSTVMSACEKVEKGLKNDETYRQAVGELEKLMQVK